MREHSTGIDTGCVFGGELTCLVVEPDGSRSFVSVGGRKVALTHYPFYAQALARTRDYDAVFSGHTHERHEERIGDTLWVNPGEILGWKGPASCVVWDTEANTAEFLERA